MSTFATQSFHISSTEDTVSAPAYSPRFAMDELDTLADFQAIRAYSRAQAVYDRKLAARDAARDEADMKEQLELMLLQADDEALLRFLGIDKGEIPHYIVEVRRDIEEHARKRVGRVSAMDWLESPRTDINALRGASASP